MNPGKENKNQKPGSSDKDDEYKKFLSMWGVTPELVDHFSKLATPDFTKEEVDNLKDLYDYCNNQYTVNVKNFLEAIDKFLSATTTKKLFKEMRDKTIQNHQFDSVKVLNTMADALSELKKSGDELIKQGKMVEAAVFTSAFDYGVGLIRQRLHDLEIMHDDIHKNFLQKDNKLKSFLDVNTATSSRKIL